MNIIICGAGRVGFTIAKQLSEQGHSITVIDQSSEDIQKIDEALDVKAIVGKATYPSILSIFKDSLTIVDTFSFVSGCKIAILSIKFLNSLTLPFQLWFRI